LKNIPRYCLYTRFNGNRIFTNDKRIILCALGVKFLKKEHRKTLGVASNPIQIGRLIHSEALANWHSDKLAHCSLGSLCVKFK